MTLLDKDILFLILLALLSRWAWVSAHKER